MLFRASSTVPAQSATPRGIGARSIVVTGVGKRFGQRPTIPKGQRHGGRDRFQAIDHGLELVPSKCERDERGRLTCARWHCAGMTTVISSSRKRRGANSGSPKESRVHSHDQVESSGGAHRHGGCGPRPRAGLRAAGIDLLRSPVTRLDADRPRGGTRGVSRGPRRAGWKRMTPPKCIPSTTALTGQESTPRERSRMAF